MSEEQRLQSLDHLIELITVRASIDFEFRRAVGSLVDDLKYVSAALCRDAQFWRLNRAFHSVHIPSLIAILTMLENIDEMKSVSEDEQHQINSSIHRAAQLASAARERIERAELNKAAVELDVLAEYAPETTKPFKKASLFERTRERIVSTSDTTLQTAKGGVEALPTVIGGLKAGVATSFARVTAVPMLASNVQKTLSGMMSDAVAKPINMRLRAGSKALTHGTGAGVGIGVVAAALFPPLLPLSAGGAVLVAMRAWQTEMQAARKLGEQERRQRIAELKVERSAALFQLTNGASSVQMETDELSLTLDAETGEADAMILKGEHAGRAWSDLSMTEKAEVVSLFAHGADILLKILALGTET